jgi:hypothetical protein
MSADAPWRDAARPPGERAAALLAEMTLDEKLPELASLWSGAELGAGNVAPILAAFGEPPAPEEAARHGLGHFTRPLGTRVDLRRVVEPGEIELMIGASSEDIRGRGAVRLTGEARIVGADRVLTTPCSITPT